MTTTPGPDGVDETNPPRTLTVVVPVYNNEPTLAELLDRLATVELPDGVQRRAVFVVDGSPDGSEALLRSMLRTWEVPSELVVLSRNFGSFAAIQTGLAHADSDYVAVLAADLQEPPELLSNFVASLETGDVDVVLGRREGRDDPLSTRVSSAAFWWTYRRLVQPEMPPGGVDVFACTRQVRDALLDLGESNSSLPGMLLWLGFRRDSVGYRRVARQVGRSGWTLRKRLRYMSNSIFSFTDLPIQLLLLTGVAVCLLALVAGIAVLAAWSLGGVGVPGYTPLILSVLFFGGINTLGLGILGSYLWRAYENTKARPTTVVRLHHRNPGDQR